MLYKCMYSDPNCRELGLQYGQVRQNAILTNAGWFSQEGEKLGVGDISMDDLARISRSLPTGEMFYVLTEANCLSLPQHLDRLAPGIEFVLDKAIWAANSADVFRIDSTINNQVLEIRDGVSYVRLARQAAINNWSVGMAVPTKIQRVEKGKHWGLDVYHMQGGTAWAVGSNSEAYDAAARAAVESLWDTDPDIIGRFIILNQDDKDSIAAMQSQVEYRCNNLLSKLLGSQLPKCLAYLLQQNGYAYYLDIIDNMQHASDDVPGLPTGLLAYRVDD